MFRFFRPRTIERSDPPHHHHHQKKNHKLFASLGRKRKKSNQCSVALFSPPSGPLRPGASSTNSCSFRGLHPRQLSLRRADGVRAMENRNRRRRRRPHSHVAGALLPRRPLPLHPRQLSLRRADGVRAMENRNRRRRRRPHSHDAGALLPRRPLPLSLPPRPLSLPPRPLLPLPPRAPTSTRTRSPSSTTTGGTQRALQLPCTP